MKRLNKISNAFYIVLFAVIFTSCVDNKTTTTKKQGEDKQRIIGKEHTVYNGRSYQIIEVDGVEYICRTEGGIYPLVNGK